MNGIKERIALQVVEGRLVLPAVIECSSLRVPQTLIDFVIDTGSSSSYLSEKEVKRLHIPIKQRPSETEVDFGGSRFKQVKLPPFQMYLLREDKEKEHFDLPLSISALKTTKMSSKKVRIAEELPSILGLDFLREQKFSLHVVLTENIAYLQYEG